MNIRVVPLAYVLSESGCLGFSIKELKGLGYL